jgi:glycosyltransferase involved in cell wall biosynthesis
LRIAQLIFGGAFGGVERHAVELSNALAKRHETVLAHTRRPGGSALEASLDTQLSPAVSRVALPKRWPGPALGWAVRQLGIDIAHSHDERASRHAVRWARGARKLATLHMPYDRRAHANCDGLVCLTDMQRSLVRGFRGQIATIGNWVLPHRQLSSEEIRALRHQFGATGNTFLIGSVGRLMPVKGFDRLVEAFRKAALPDSRLVILGDGPLRDELARQGGSQVLLPGFQSNVKDCYQAFDLFVSSSRWENYPLAVLEAMDAGLPILCTAIAGSRASLGDMPLTWVAPDDAAALKIGLRAMYEQRPGRRIYAMERHRLEQRVPEIETFYALLLSPPS